MYNFNIIKHVKKNQMNPSPFLPLHTHAAIQGYIPVIHRSRKVDNTSTNWILSSREIRSLIMSALIFLTIFAWMDVIAIKYKNYIMGSDINASDNINAGIPLTHKLSKLPHRLPSNLAETISELNVKSKIGYAVILSCITSILYLGLSLPFSSHTVSKNKQLPSFGRDFQRAGASSTIELNSYKQFYNNTNQIE